MKQPTKTTLYLPEELHAQIKIEAARRRISMTKLVVQAIEYELERLTGDSTGGKSENQLDSNRKGANDQ